MASVGQQLTSPEYGMRRIDDTDGNFSFTGAWYLLHSNYAGQYNSTICLSEMNNNAKIRFNVSGTTKLYVIACGYNDRSTNITISIDGVAQTFSEKDNSSLTYQYVYYVSTGLSTGEHSVEIWNTTGEGRMAFDAIDIDTAGVVKPYNTTPAVEEPAQIFYGGM